MGNIFTIQTSSFKNQPSKSSLPFPPSTQFFFHSPTENHSSSLPFSFLYAQIDKHEYRGHLPTDFSTNTSLQFTQLPLHREFNSTQPSHTLYMQESIQPLHSHAHLHARFWAVDKKLLLSRRDHGGYCGGSPKTLPTFSGLHNTVVAGLGLGPCYFRKWALTCFESTYLLWPAE